MIKDDTRTWLRRAVVAALATAAFATAAASATPPPPARVVSINLCTDELLMALAEPHQIAAVSTLARDPRLSAMTHEASRYPSIAGSAEEVLKLRPDLVLAGSFTRRETREILARFHIPIATFDPVTDVAGALSEIRTTAALLGTRQRGEALVARIEAQLAAAGNAGHDLVVLPLQRRGFASGAGTLISDLLGRLGAVNAASRAGLVSVAPLATEEILRARPDVLILDELEPVASDQGTALLLHPAIATAIPKSRRIDLPVRLVTCAGPTLPAAIAHLAAGLARSRPR